jgi:4-amino-4-deoxy-L-arabinose transferase-like glycosyltransferase
MSEQLETEIDAGSEAFGPDPAVAVSIADLPANQLHSSSSLVAAVASVVLLLIVFGFFIWTGIRGMDFGRHWDEGIYQIKPVKTMVATGILLPQTYTYPSFDFWLNLAVAVPDFLKAVREANAAVPAPEESRRMAQQVRAKTLEALDTPAYVFRGRTTYLVITALTLVWVFLTVLVWEGTPLQAVFAAALLGSSWEVAYHSRWIACDCILMQFAALTILLCSLAARRPTGAKWLVPAAIAAGLATGTKYTGGTLLLPVLIAAYIVRGRSAVGQSAIRMVAKIVVSFAVVFLVTTPAAVLEPARFFRDVRHEVFHYGKYGHGNYTVAAGLSHGLKILEYMGMVVFSHYAAFAAFFFLLAILGVYAMLRQFGLAALIVMVFPIVSLGFMTNMRAMIVRNDLPPVPALAVLSSFGLASVYGRLKAKPLRLGLACIALAGLFTNEAWLFWCTQTIVDRQSDRFAREAADYVRSNPATKFYLTPKVRAVLQAQGAVDLPNVTADPAQSTVALIWAKADVNLKDGPANIRDLSQGWFGPYEINWDYYTTWKANDRIVIMDTPRATKLGMVPGLSIP